MSERITIHLETLDTIHRDFLERTRGRCAIANGCFDRVHLGHLSLFAFLDTMAYKRKLRPLIALNSDDSVRALKGPTRPNVPQESRAALLNHLKWPFTVIIFDEPSPQRLMDILQPAVVVKGDEYDPATVVKWSGSEVVTVPMVKGYSTSKILGDTR